MSLLVVFKATDKPNQTCPKTFWYFSHILLSDGLISPNDANANIRKERIWSLAYCNENLVIIVADWKPSFFIQFNLNNRVECDQFVHSSHPSINRNCECENSRIRLFAFTSGWYLIGNSQFIDLIARNTIRCFGNSEFRSKCHMRMFLDLQINRSIWSFLLSFDPKPLIIRIMSTAQVISVQSTTVRVHQ